MLGNINKMLTRFVEQIFGLLVFQKIQKRLCCLRRELIAVIAAPARLVHPLLIPLDPHPLLPQLAVLSGVEALPVIRDVDRLLFHLFRTAFWLEHLFCMCLK